MHPCITALCGCLYASLHNDFVRPLSCILCTFMNALLVSHPCETLGVHFIRHPCLTRKLRVLPPAAPKIIPRLLSGRKCSGVVESCLLCWFRIVRNFGQALSRILAFAVVWVAASVHRQPFVPLHRATALCGCLYASMHNDFVRPLSCILCTFMNALLVSHPCETLGVHFIRHPCLTRKLRVLPPTNTQKV